MDNVILRLSKRYRRFLLFAFVGGVGTIINTAILWALTGLGLYYLAATIATEAAIISNFFGNHFLTFKDSSNSSPLGIKFLKFQAVSMAALGVTLLVIWLLTSAFGKGQFLVSGIAVPLLVVWNLLAIFASFLINFSLNARFTWSEKTPTARPGRKMVG